MRNIPILSRKRALKELGDIANSETTTLRILIATWLFAALMKEIVGGEMHVFTYFDREHTYEEVHTELVKVLEDAGLHRFVDVPGGLTDQHNYIRILTVDSIYERKYLVPVYEAMLAAENVEANPAAIDTTKPFLYVAESQLVDFPWVLQELLMHLDRPLDLKTLYCIPPEIEPIKKLVEDVLSYAGLSYETHTRGVDEGSGVDEYEISAIDPTRYGLFLQVMEKPDRHNAELDEQIQQLKSFDLGK